MVQGRLFIFAQTLSQPCSIGCNQVGIAFVEVLNPSDDPLSWRYTTDDITDTWWEPGTSWPTALTVANDTAYLLGRNVRIYDNTKRSARNSRVINNRKERFVLS